jgi:iron complex transport system ATP-binding protein
LAKIVEDKNHGSEVENICFFPFSMSNIIEVKNISFSYTSQRIVLKDVSFDVKAGTFLSIAGPNGVGKTTLINLLCGLLRAQAGSITIDTTRVESYSVGRLAQKVAVVRQEFVPIFDFKVIEVVSMGRTPYLGTLGFESKTDRQIVNTALKATDTARFAQRSLGSLSGGERQRIFIARALAQDTPILLLDEPTSFLDLKNQIRIYDLLKTAQLEKGKTIMAVTHDINLAAQYCDEVLLLRNSTTDSPQPQNSDQVGCNYHLGKTTDVLTPEQVEKVFGVKTFAGRVGREKFFIPLGKFAKDIAQISGKSNSYQQK